MKKAFILVLAILFTGLFTIACESSSGENEKSSTGTRNGGEETTEIESSAELWANQIFYDLSEDVKKQIIPDFLEAAENEYFYGGLREFFMCVCIGTYNEWVIIGLGAAHDALPIPIIIDGIMVSLTHNMHCWKYNANPEKNNFYRLQEACDLGFFTLNDLQKMREEWFDGLQQAGGNNKENVLNVIKFLERREDIIYAGPDFYMKL